MFKTERNLFLIFLSLLVISTFIVDCYLLQRVHEYFKGGMLNRSFALSQASEYFLFSLQSLAYSFFTYGSLAVAISYSSKKLLKYNPIQSVYVTFSTLGIIILLHTLIEWKIFQYLGHNFDFGVLQELTDGDFGNILGYLKLKQLFIALLLAALFTANLFIPKLFSNRITIQPACFMSALKLIAPALLLLSVNHFATRTLQSLRFGLSEQLSFTLFDIALKTATDFDRDGFGPLTSPRDPDNFNSSVHAYALDIPDNGIDENGFFGDFTKDINPTSLAGKRLESKQMNVLFIVVETFRTDVLGMQIDGQEVMPFLNNLTKTHATTKTAYSNSGVTSRSIQGSLFGSLHFKKGDKTLFDVFAEAGYKTMVASAQNETWGSSFSTLRMEEVDEYYDARQYDWSKEKLSSYEKMNIMHRPVDGIVLNSEIFKKIDSSGDSPFFMYVNYQDLHYPYFHNKMEKVFITKPEHHSSFFKKENREAIVRQYANGAHHLDKVFQQLIQGLEERSLFEKTMIVIVGDHPDSFYENGLMGHGWSLDKYQRMTPLIVINALSEYSSVLGQNEIADIIINSLNSDETDKAFRFNSEPEKQIFVFSGALETPRQIGFISPTSLISYDFKTNLVQIDEAQYPLDMKSVRQKSKIKPLIQYWEGLVNAKTGVHETEEKPSL